MKYYELVRICWNNYDKETCEVINMVTTLNHAKKLRQQYANDYFNGNFFIGNKDEGETIHIHLVKITRRDDGFVDKKVIPLENFRPI